MKRDLGAAAVPFVWLAIAVGFASLLAFLLADAALAFLPGTADLVDWNPFASAVEVEIPGADGDELTSLALALEQTLPDSVASSATDGDGPTVVVVARTDAAILARDVIAVAKERGLATGAFSMGPNLGRIAARVLDEPGSTRAAAASLLPIALLCGSGVLLALGYVLRRRLDPAPLPPAGSKARRIGLGVALGIALSLAIGAMSELAARLGTPITEQPWLRQSLQAGGLRWLAVLPFVVLLAPLGEEVFFRGYMLPALARALGPTGAVFLSALAFAAVHGHAPALPAYFVYGVALAVAARRTGSLYTPIAAHATVNTLAVLALAWSAWRGAG